MKRRRAASPGSARHPGALTSARRVLINLGHMRLLHISLPFVALTLLSVACGRSESRAIDSAQSPPPAVASAVDTNPAPAVPTAATAASTDTATAEPVRTTPPPMSCTVTDSSMGPIRLGMTLAQAKQAAPEATFKREYDGEGIASVDVISDGVSLINLVADDDEGETIDLTKRIMFMETFSRWCSTADGVHPDALVTDVEKILGKVTNIMLSEIESREFVSFERQPDKLTFRIDYTGIFEGDARNTKRFEPEAKIWSIGIMSR